MFKIRNLALLVILVSVSFAAEGGNMYAYLGAALGAGMISIGAGLGIGMLASGGADATARQPEAANDIRSTINLPLFLLEGVAIIGLVVCILAIVL